MTKEFIQLRNEVNKIDNQIILLLKKRLKIVERIKKFKLSRGMPFEDQLREDQILDSKVEKSGLPRYFVKNLFSIIFKESKRIQR